MKNKIKKILNIIKIDIINNKGLVYLFFSLFILDLSLRAFYYSAVDFYGWYRLIPNLFTTIWILFILGLTKCFKNKFGKIIYLFSYIFSLVAFVTHAIYFSFFKTYFDFGVLKVASEGADYFDSIWPNVKWWVIVVFLVSIILTILGLKNFKDKCKIEFKKVLIITAIFCTIKLIIPFCLGNVKTSIEWDDWRNPRIIYNNFNDNNKSMMIAGMYEYNIRNFYINYIKDNSEITETEAKILEENFNSATLAETNKYTGLYKDKNLIIIQLESIDQFLITKSTMPTLYKMMNNSINFTNHYSYTSGGGSTFNSEFMVNVGYSTAFNYNQGAYLLSRNDYSYSLPHLFKNLGYQINAYHMNTKEYYSRGVNYSSFGFDHYYGLKDLGEYKDNSYWLDTELVKNETFNKALFNTDKPSVSYMITYSAHLPFTNKKGTCSLLTDTTKELSEYECLKIQAKETDDFVALLLENLKEKQMLDNTVIAVFADHYIYTLEDESILDKYKETSNNLINKTPFFIWDGKTKKTIKDVNSQLDILPTLLNLFGISYYPNYYLGRDILDNDFMSLVYFPDGSWYNGSTYVTNGEYQSGKKMKTTKINEINELVKKKIDLNDAVLKSNYFSKINNS